MNNKKLDIKRKQGLQDIKLKLDKYLNRNFYTILKNLKLDTNEQVAEFLQYLEVSLDHNELDTNVPQDDQLSSEITEPQAFEETEERTRALSQNFDRKSNDMTFSVTSKMNEAYYNYENNFLEDDDLRRVMSATSDLLNFDSLN